MELDEEQPEIIDKYKRKISEELYGSQTASESPEKNLISEDYLKFKKQFMPAHLSIYEKLCNISASILRIKPDPKEAKKIEEAISITHLETTPSGVVAFSYLGPLALALFGTLITFALFNSMFFLFYFIVICLVAMILLRRTPEYLANSWRLKASNQMVQCIFYVVTYMRHTPNFENSLAFASEHLSPPLSLDIMKVLWDVETGKYDTVKDSLNAYLETWRKWNMEFIEAFHLIESSLYEPNEARRLGLIEKALDVMLTETYDKMLHYTHELRSPITVLHMIGIILPVLGLVILPMVTSFLTSEKLTPGKVALYLSVLYNVTLPVIVYVFGRVILTKRPTGYGDTDISNEFPEYKRYRYIYIKLGNLELKINPAYIAGTLGFILVAIGVYPLLYKFITPKDILLAEKPFLFNIFQVFGYKENMNQTAIIGPYGLVATLLSIFTTAGLGLGLGLFYKLRSRNVIKIREETKALEKEFASGLFQLGNRIGDGVPTEIAFQNVAKVMKHTRSGEFFRIVANNIINLGLGVRDAIFNPKNGALLYFPSNLIKSTMKVLIESAKKGPQVCSRTLLTVSEYIKEIHRVNERLRDLMAEIISSMKQQVNFMAPVISGVVIGITSMLVTILSILRENIANLDTSMDVANQGGLGVLTMFGDTVPAYYFQLIVGIYVVEIVYVLTVLINGVENGSDKLSEQYLLGQNLIKSTIVYCTITFIVVLMFNLIAGMVLQGVKFA